MKVYKFGGASVKDAEGIMNVGRVLSQTGFEECLLVVSAMGKTTNALEDAVELYFKNGDFSAVILAVEGAHLSIVKEIFTENHPIFSAVRAIFSEALDFLRRNKSPNYNFVYDQVVSCGELASSAILSAWLNENGFKNKMLDARDFIKTDSQYREGRVDWQETEKNILKIPRHLSFVTQGFIGSDADNFTVTLGREGSDYSAAIFAFALDAASMTIWKDVAGVMTGDPRKFENVRLLNHISYEEAVEMAYYGASVIHPKTLQPLKQKDIPFFVKSFLNPQAQGTKIGNSEQNESEESYILKQNQVLMQISSRDFSFIAEEHLSLIFGTLAQFGIKISLMQNTAISLKLCLEDKFNKTKLLQKALSKDFNTAIKPGVSLFTIRNYKGRGAENFFGERDILLEQMANGTLQMVIN